MMSLKVQCASIVHNGGSSVVRFAKFDVSISLFHEHLHGLEWTAVVADLSATIPERIASSIVHREGGTGDLTGGNADLWNADNSFLLVTSFLLSFIKKNKNCLHEVTVRLFTSVCCCVGRLVYGTTSLLHLQKRTLTAEIIRFFTAIQRALAASNLIVPKSEITDCHLLLRF